MKISLSWLTDFVTLKNSNPQMIADRLTASTGEVEDILEQGRFLGKCCVGKVEKLIPHPNADKLRLVDVQTDKGIVRVVCGATNLREGMLIAFAHAGATVQGRDGGTMTLATVKIRGEESSGMICAAEELDLSALFPPKKEDGERPIVDLTPLNLKVGTPLKTALGLGDAVLHIDNHAITNRPDLFSHKGIARELVALGLGSWKKQSKQKLPSFPKTKGSFKCVNQIPKLVPRYLSCHLQVESLGSTPKWMAERLAACGVRSISLPVDITNYVSLELGMPLHSFDADDLSGDVRIHTSKKGDIITTLDGVKRNLPEGAIVLSDAKGIFDLLGIMGGERSSTKPTTKHIYLHAAVADAASIRRAIIATGHRTDASTVYEKDIQPVTAEEGFFRALELFLELVPGARISSSLETWGTNGKAKAILLPKNRAAEVMGIAVPPKEIVKILSDLGCSVKTSAKGFLVTPPLHRLHDLSTAYELVEEVARIHGYERIPAAMPRASIQPPKRDTRLNTLRDALKDNRYTELLHLAFVSPSLCAKMKMNAADALKIENALGEELSLLRLNILSSLLETAGREMRQSSTALKLFEVGNIFSKKGGEQTRLCLLIAAKGKTTLKDDPLLTLKADVLRTARAAGYTLSFEQMSKDLPPSMHPGRAASVYCQGTYIGCMAEVHSSITKAVDLPARAAFISLDTKALFALKPDTLVIKALPVFPAISYDETLPMNPKRTYGELMKKVLGQSPLLKNVEMVDLYEDASSKRMTLRFTYRADDRTLSEDEVRKVHSGVVQALR